MKQNGSAHPRFIVCVTAKQKTLFRETLFRESISVDFEKHVFIGFCAKQRLMSMQEQSLCFSLSTKGHADECFDDVFVYRVRNFEIQKRLDICLSDSRKTV